MPQDVDRPCQARLRDNGAAAPSQVSFSSACCGVSPGIAHFFGILIGEFVQREAAAIGDFDRARQRFRIAREQPCHLLRRFQITIGMALAPEPGVVDGAVVRGCR